MLLARFECPDKGAILVFIPMRQKQRGQCERKKKVCTGCLSKFLCSVCTCADSTCEYFLPPPSTHALLFMIVAIVSSLCPLDAVSRVQQQDWLYEQAKKTKCFPFEVLCWLKRMREKTWKDCRVMPHLLLASILLQDMGPAICLGRMLHFGSTCPLAHENVHLRAG